LEYRKSDEVSFRISTRIRRLISTAISKKKIKLQTFNSFLNSSLSVIPGAKYCGHISFYKARIIYTANFHTKTSNALQGSSWNADNCSLSNRYVLRTETIHGSHGTRHLPLMTAQALNISHVLQTVLLLIGFPGSISFLVHFQVVTVNC
jgi:hypothetical protein